MSSREFRQWQRYAAKNGPLGSKRLYLAAGIIAAAVYNARRTKNTDKVLSPEDFVPEFETSMQSTAVEQPATTVSPKVASFLTAIKAPLPPQSTEEK